MSPVQFAYPTTGRIVTDDYADHVARGSVNPGTDYAVAVGTPVYAIAAGTIAFADSSTSGSGGRMMGVNHAGGYQSQYLHLSRLVRTGGTVAQGELIAYSGGSGYNQERYYGPHLHLSLKSGGRNIDFEKVVNRPIPGPSGAAIAVDGEWGPETTKALQRALGVTVDGRLGPQTYTALQRKTGATPDGRFGPASKRALQRYLGVTQDGNIGPITVKAMQTRLRAGTF